MCLIIILPADTDKFSDIIKEAITRGFDTNKDGAGFCYLAPEGKAVYYNKGFFLEETLINAIKKEKVDKKDILMIHFRNGNVGEDQIFNCHPFVLSKDTIELESYEGKTPIGTMMHNGTFYKYNTYYKNKKESDTYEFVQDFMHIPEFISLLKRDKKEFEKHFSTLLSTNKLAFLFPDVGIRLIGEWKEDSGYFFSNEGYKKKVVDYGGSNYWPGIGMGQDDGSPFEDDSVIENKRKGIQPNKGFVENNKENKQNCRVKDLLDNKLSFVEFRLKITKDNLHELKLVCRSEFMPLLELGKSYCISNSFDPKCMTQIMYKEGVDNHYFCVSTKVIHNTENFLILPRKAFIQKYMQLLRLVNYYGIIPSKNAYKKLVKKYEQSSKKDEVNLSKHGLGSVLKVALQLYLDIELERRERLLSSKEEVEDVEVEFVESGCYD